MDDQRDRWKWIYIWLFPALLFLLTYISLGCYYGWVDDVLIMNFMRGILSGRSYPPTDQFRIISGAYIALYHAFPTVAWYGLLLFGYCYLATVALFGFLYEVFDIGGLNQRTTTLFLFLLLFFILFLAENVYLINFTRISILMIGSSLLCVALILRKEQITFTGYLYLSFYYALFILGYLIRYETAIFPIITGLLFAFLILYQSKRNKKRFFFHVLIIAGLLLSYGAYEKFNKSPDTSAYDRKRPYVFNLLDGANLSIDHAMLSDPQDSIRQKAVLMWYYYDDQQITTRFLERMGGSNPFEKRTLLNWAQNLKAEYRKIKERRESYEKGMNLFDKFLWATCFNLAVLLAIWLIYLSLRSGLDWAIKASIYNLLFYLIFFLATVFVKYEDRVFTPSAVILLSGNLFFLFSQMKTNNFRPNKIWVGVLLIVLIFLSLFRINTHRGIAAEKKIEVEQKEKFINSLNTDYKGKIFLYDLWSQTLLHSSAFKNIYLDPSNIHTVFGDLPYQDYDSHQQYLKRAVCDYDKFIDFYDCIYGKREKVVFVMVDFRRSMIEDYLKVLYNRPYRFDVIDNSSPVEGIRYSFVWDPLYFHLCQINK